MIQCQHFWRLLPPNEHFSHLQHTAMMTGHRMEKDITSHLTLDDDDDDEDGKVEKKHRCKPM